MSTDRGPVPDRFLPVKAVLEKLAIGKSTFYRMLPDLEDAGVAVRVPPVTGHLRVKERAMEEWLTKANRKTRRAI